MANYRATGAIQCARCGNPMEPSTATYDKGGNLMCRSCAALVTIAEGDQRAVGSLITSAVAVPLLGLLSWTCLNQFGICSILTIVSGISWIVMVGRAEPYRKRMGNSYGPCLAGVIIGMVIAIAPLMLLAATALIASFAHVN
jgi:hypothetical protein